MLWCSRCNGETVSGPPMDVQHEEEFLGDAKMEKSPRQKWEVLSQHPQQNT